jgi:hypothetical protein
VSRVRHCVLWLASHRYTLAASISTTSRLGNWNCQKYMQRFPSVPTPTPQPTPPLSQPFGSKPRRFYQHVFRPCHNSCSVPRQTPIDPVDLCRLADWLVLHVPHLYLQHLQPPAASSGHHLTDRQSTIATFISGESIHEDATESRASSNNQNARRVH